MEGTAPSALLQVRGVSKTFPGQRALVDVDLDVRRGEVHALLGQNGSGKSTLIKILAGYHEADPGGTILVADHELPSGVPGAGHALGLRFVHQDLALVPTLNLIDNLALGRRYRTSRLGRIRWSTEAAAARLALSDLGLDLDPFASLDELSLAEQAGLAIARAVHDDVDGARVLVLDEPTAALPAAEVDRLFAVLRRLRDRGMAILLVTHHLDEVLEIADRVTVLRDGRCGGPRPRDVLDHDQLVKLIVGRSVATVPPRADDPERGEPCLTVNGVSGGRVREFSTQVRHREVVGVAGLDGSGRESVIALLTGQAHRASGTVLVGQTPVAPFSPRSALRAGMAFVPSERARAGLFATMSVRENLTIGRLRQLARLGRIRRGVEHADVCEWIDRLQVVTPGPDVPIATLSGGNQQKVLVGRSLRLSPAVLVLDEPTQGVDVGARSEMHRILDDAVLEGMGVLVASTDTDELVRLCDRVHILQGGHVVRTLHRGHDLSVDELDHAQISRTPQELAR